MDADLKSIAAARRAAETAFDAYQKFLGTDPAPRRGNTRYRGIFLNRLDIPVSKFYSL